MTEPGTVPADSVSTPLSPGEVDRRLAVVNSFTDAQRNYLLGGLALLVTSADFTAAITCAEDCPPPTGTVSR